MHVRGYSGSHIIIKSKDPDYNTLQDAIQLALFHSKAREQKEGEVCVTQKKYVARLKNGQIGQVQVSKHSIYYAHLDLDYYQKIKQRNQKTFSS